MATPQVGVDQPAQRRWPGPGTGINTVIRKAESQTARRRHRRQHRHHSARSPGFGSIIVNGLELEFNRNTTVASDGKPASLEELRVGQVVQGVAKPRDGKLQLDSLDIQHAVTGPIGAIDQAAQTMTVLGQHVRLNLGGDKTAMDAFKTLQKGDVVSVSGLAMADGTIMATRVDQQRDDDRIIAARRRCAVTANRRTRRRSQHSDCRRQRHRDARGAVGRWPRVRIGPHDQWSVRTRRDCRPARAALRTQSVTDASSIETYAPLKARVRHQRRRHVRRRREACPPALVERPRRRHRPWAKAPDHVTAAAIAKVRTVVTILQARGTAAARGHCAPT